MLSNKLFCSWVAFNLNRIYIYQLFIYFAINRKPQEDSEVIHPSSIPDLDRIAGNRLPGQAMADLLMVFEFLHNFGETLGFGKYSRYQC